MTKPTWVKILGILMVLIGGCGGAQDLKLTKTKSLIDFQKDITHEIDKHAEIQIDSNNIEIFKTVTANDSLSVTDTVLSGATLAQTFKEITHIPPASAQTLVKLGYVGLFFSLLYILAGIGFIQFKKNVVPFATAVLVLCLCYAGYSYFEIRNTELSSLFKTGINFQIMFGVIFDVLFLIIILAANKDYYTQTSNELEDYYDTA